MSARMLPFCISLGFTNSMVEAFDPVLWLFAP